MRMRRSDQSGRPDAAVRPAQTAYLATAISSHSTPEPGVSAGMAQPPAISIGCASTGAAKSSHSRKCAPGVAHRRWAEISGKMCDETGRPCAFARLAASSQPVSAADLHDVGHSEIAGTGCHRLLHVGQPPPVLAQLDRRLDRTAHHGVAGEIVMQDRLLHPGEMVMRFHQANAPDGLGDRERLVVVGHDVKAVAACLADGADHRHVAGRFLVAELDLEGGKAHLHRALGMAPRGLGRQHRARIIGRHRARRRSRGAGQAAGPAPAPARPRRPCPGLRCTCR